MEMCRQVASGVCPLAAAPARAFARGRSSVPASRRYGVSPVKRSGAERMRYRRRVAREARRWSQGAAPRRALQLPQLMLGTFGSDVEEQIVPFGQCRGVCARHGERLSHRSTSSSSLARFARCCVSGACQSKKWAVLVALSGCSDQRGRTARCQNTGTAPICSPPARSMASPPPAAPRTPCEHAPFKRWRRSRSVEAVRFSASRRQTPGRASSRAHGRQERQVRGLLSSVPERARILEIDAIDGHKNLYYLPAGCSITQWLDEAPTATEEFKTNQTATKSRPCVRRTPRARPTGHQNYRKMNSTSRSACGASSVPSRAVAKRLVDEVLAMRAAHRQVLFYRRDRDGGDARGAPRRASGRDCDVLWRATASGAAQPLARISRRSRSVLRSATASGGP